jgi:hypothetical protein
MMRQKPLNRLMLVSKYRRRRFASEKPSEKTIQCWIMEGTIPGKKLGGRYYAGVTEEAKQITGDPWTDRRLWKTAEELGIRLIDDRAWKIEVEAPWLLVGTETETRVTSL